MLSNTCMISGLSHVTFAVSDLERSICFYTRLVGLKPLVQWDQGAYLVAGNFWVSLVLDRAAPEATNNSSYTHVAFAVSPEEFQALRTKLVMNDAEEWQLNPSPGESYYFLDPDGHKIEIHTRTLSDRLASLRENPKSGIVWL